MSYAVGIRSALVIIGLLGTSTSACKKAKEKEGNSDTQSTTEVAKTATTAASDAAPVKAKATWYRVRMQSEKPKAEVPFYLSLPAHDSEGKATLVQGSEKTELAIAWTNSTHFEVKFGIFPSVIRAALDPVRSFEGEWEQNSGSWGDAKMTLRATPVDGPDNAMLFPLSEGEVLKPNQAAGAWTLEMNDSGSVKLELFEEKGAAHGFLYFKSGNIIALAGRSSNGKLKLGGFDGTSAYLMDAEFAEDGTLKAGKWLAGATLNWAETFTGKKGANFEMASGPSMSDPKDGVIVEGVEFGAYEGKPLIIEMAGSWCITCRYAAPYLRDIYAEFHPKGLEMVTLAYEFTDDAEYNKKRAQAFKDEYKLEWDVIPVMGDTESFADIIPMGLENLDVSGFPISIFVGRDGAVKHIHAGFPGAKESEAYETITKEYRAKVAELVAPE